MKYFNALRFIAQRRCTGYTTAIASLKHGCIVTPTHRDATTIGQLIKNASDLITISMNSLDTTRFDPNDRQHPLIPDNQLLFLAVQEADKELEARRSTISLLTNERDEADRRAGAVERQLEYDRDTIFRSDRWRDGWKEKLGYNKSISFDIVMNDLVSKARPDVKVDGETTKISEPKDTTSTDVMYCSVCSYIRGETSTRVKCPHRHGNLIKGKITRSE